MYFLVKRFFLISIYILFQQDSDFIKILIDQELLIFILKKNSKRGSFSTLRILTKNEGINLSVRSVRITLLY